jgi:hypothetical protein
MHSWSTLVFEWTTGNHRLTRFTTTRIWGKLPPSPTVYFVAGHGTNIQMAFSPKIPKVGTLATLGARNFVWRSPIEMRYKAKLLRAFQRYVTCHLHARKSGRLPTLLLALTCVSIVQMGHASPLQICTFQEVSNDIKNSLIQWFWPLQFLFEDLGITLGL